MQKIIALFMVIMLSACQTLIDNDTYTKGESGLTQVTYKATDDLMRQVNDNSIVSSSTPILVGTFADLENVEETTNLGRAVAEQMTTRLVQLGYHISEVKLRDQMQVKPEGEFVLSRKDSAVTRTHEASVIVSGTYAVANEVIMLNARVTNASTGQMIAAQDFIIERDNQVEALLLGEKDFLDLPWYTTKPFFKSGR